MCEDTIYQSGNRKTQIEVGQTIQWTKKNRQEYKQ